MSTVNFAGVALPSIDGAELCLEDYRGAPFVLVLGNQRTSKLVPELVDRLHGHAAADDIFVVQIAHLVGVPRMLRWVAERDIGKGVRAHREALRESRAERGLDIGDEERRLAIGLDCEGRVTGALGFTSASVHPLVAVVDEELSVRAATRDADSDAAVEQLLQALNSQPG